MTILLKNKNMVVFKASVTKSLQQKHFLKSWTIPGSRNMSVCVCLCTDPEITAWRECMWEEKKTKNKRKSVSELANSPICMLQLGLCCRWEVEEEGGCCRCWWRSSWAEGASDTLHEQAYDSAGSLSPPPPGTTLASDLQRETRDN